jgi:hypothetical protein
MPEGAPCLAQSSRDLARECKEQESNLRVHVGLNCEGCGSGVDHWEK